MNSQIARLLLALLIMAASPLTGRSDETARFSHRWFYLMTNLLVDENADKADALLQRAHDAGYNGMVITDSKFDRLNDLGDNTERYFRNVRRVKATAARLGIGIYPQVCTLGYEGGVLQVDPNLAEGLMVENAPFVVENGAARPAMDGNPPFLNGDFEDAAGDKMNGWNYQDGIGTSTFCDRAEHHNGAASLRMENIAAGTESSNARVVQAVNLVPHRVYHLSVWIKTQDFETPRNARAIALDGDDHNLMHVQWDIKATQDWTRYDAVVNSDKWDKARIYLGVWGGRGGQIWWDDITLEDAGLSNLLRREGCPLVVKGEDGTVYQEGRDFAPVVDEKLGRVPWLGNYDVYHAGPDIQITPNSRIVGGQRLSVSYYSVVKVDAGSVAPCLSEPKTYEVLRDQMRRVCDLWQPAGLFLSQDEMRQMNSCALCRERGLDAGALLADSARRCVQIAREIAPDAPLFIWSDMFDPHHNAVNNYYLVRGDLAGSWEGLDKDVSIANWNFEHRDASLKFFAERGHHQILSGYYDAGPEQIREWMDAAKGVPDVDGAMYTTWENRYDDLEAFAKIAWGG